ncbi:MAG TPA: DUF1707 domain-containing protein [Pseudonocardiaceae bacterium]|nr:DUF1707 domain-containing protein [Pseudonocardiaceae bacterium]
MSDLPEPPPTDQQRDAAIARLTEHIGAGHLTLAEFDERAQDSYRATSAAELARVTADLPALDTPSPARPVPRRWLVSLFGGADITGRSRLDRRLNSITVMGGNELDLRHAELDGGELTINAVAVMGGQDIYLPEGVEVQVDGFALFGGNDQHGGGAPARPGAPVIRIQAVSIMGGIDVWRVPTEASRDSLADARRHVRAISAGHRWRHW